MKGKVLVIEDNIDWQEDLRHFLEVAGFHVETVDTLSAALKIVEKEMFHFITIDMQLDESTAEPKNWEGWDILEVINKLRIRDITPTMVITGFSEDYAEFKKVKHLEGICFMYKEEFDRSKFIEQVEYWVNRIDLRFKNDYRGD